MEDMSEPFVQYQMPWPANPQPLRPAALPLMRPKQGRWLCGVCRGISLHLGVSVALVRLLFAAATLAFGAGVVMYVFLWLMMPVGDPVAEAEAQRHKTAETPLSRGNVRARAAAETDPLRAAEHDESSESLAAAIARAPKPALVAMAGLLLLIISALMAATGIDSCISCRSCSSWADWPSPGCGSTRRRASSGPCSAALR